MGINVFEGARRIAKLVTLLWVAGCVIYTINDVLDLRKQNLETQEKQSSIAKETPYQQQKSRPSTFEERNTQQDKAQQTDPPSPELIAKYDAWKANKQQSKQLSGPTLEEIAAYRAKNSHENQPSQEFPIFNKADLEGIEPEKNLGQKIWEHIGTSLIFLLGGVAFIWALTWAIGWIVRGFFGIPSGHDFKP